MRQTRWSQLGVWERLLRMAQEQDVGFGMAFLDGTSCRAHQKAAGAANKARQRRSGTSARRLDGSKQCFEPWGLRTHPASLSITHKWTIAKMRRAESA